MSVYTTRMRQLLQTPCQRWTVEEAESSDEPASRPMSPPAVSYWQLTGKGYYVMLSTESSVAGQTYFKHNILNAQDTELQQHEAIER